MSIAVISSLSLLLATFGPVSVTNHAGHVISGELTSVTNGTFTISGRTLPLSVLPPIEQQRLKFIAGQDTRTTKERQRAKLLEYELQRIQTRLDAGEITPAEAELLRQQARASAKNNPCSSK